MTSPDKTKLKSCPFCGGRAAFAKKYAYCTQCKASCRSSDEDHEMITDDWNQRTPTPNSDEVERLREALKVAQQAIAEISHAQNNGPSWYTKGESGLYQQVKMWIRKASKEIEQALNPTQADRGIK